MSSSDVTGLLIGLLNAWAFSLQCAIQWARVTTVIHTHTHTQNNVSPQQKSQCTHRWRKLLETHSTQKLTEVCV